MGRDRRIGVIGAGNMGSAMICGILRAGLYGAGQVMAADPSAEAIARLRDGQGIQTTADNREAAAFADILLLAVKPNLLLDVIGEVRDAIREETIVVSIAAGKTIGEIEGALGRKAKVARAMPNTPALVGEGMTALSGNGQVTADEMAAVRELFESFGRCEEIKEALMDAAVGVGGSSPAYVFLLLEAMADGAVLGGMPRQQAYVFAAQSVLGAAKMVLETGRHPGELKDMVCSPAGTTIEGVAKLEEMGFRSAVIEAVRACMEKSKEMSGKIS